MHRTVISSWALLIARALQSDGHDAEALVRRAGLDPAKLRDPAARYSTTGMLRLWELAAAVTGDEAFGLRAASFWHPTSFHALGYSWLASSTLGEALQRLARYARVVSSAVRVGLEHEGGRSCLRTDLDPSSPMPSPVAFDTGAAVLVRMCRTSYGADFSPLRVGLPRPRPADAARYHQFFRAPVEFETPNLTIWFDRRDLDTPLPTANAELAMANDRIVTAYLARLDRTHVGMQVRALLLEQLPSGRVTEDAIAGGLNMSLRSLQRRLKAEGTTYQALLDEMRHELAAQYMAQSRLSINEITFLLGFSEPSNFSRAFKRWTGVAPSAFRGSVAGPGPDASDARPPPPGRLN